MPKPQEELDELIKTELFRQGIKKKLISFNFEKSLITYHAKNSIKRKFANPEESVQATAFLKLVLEYDYAPAQIAINPSVQVGSNTVEADILVYDSKGGKVLIVVECKEENVNERQFKIATDQAFSYAHASTARYVWVTSGVKDEYFEIAEVSPVLRVPISDIPKRDGKVQEFKYTKETHEPQKGSQSELIQKFKSAHDALWGGGALAPTTAFDELDKLIFCKIWDERWIDHDPQSAGKPFDFQIIYYPEDRKNMGENTPEYDRNIKAKTELEKRVRALYERGRLKDKEVFKDDIKLDKHKIFTVVQYLQDINFSKTDLDAKGVAFQSFMGAFFRGEFGQFFTPKPIVEFITASLNITKDMRVLDTSCGSGGFLLHALKSVRDQADEFFKNRENPIAHRNYWHDFAEKNLFGIEINEQISRVAKMNMIIHDDGHTNVITNDALKPNELIHRENENREFTDGTFDLIMTNPPFGKAIKADEVTYVKDYELFEKNLGITELKPREQSDYNAKGQLNPKKWRTSQSGEVLFLERCHKYLKEGGILAIVVPDGILSNSTSQYVRDWLMEKFRILAIASLPQHTFSHVNAGVKSSVLFLKKYPAAITQQLQNAQEKIKESIISKKRLSKEEKEVEILRLYSAQLIKLTQDNPILMLNIENIGYDPTGKPIEGSQLEAAAGAIREQLLID